MSTWRSFLLEISKTIPAQVLFEWRFLNGATFHMFVPNESEFESNTFCRDIEFPFEFDELLELRTVVTFPQYHLSEKVNRTLREVASRYEKLQVSQDQTGTAVSITCKND
jgi:hypothetical protein